MGSNRILLGSLFIFIAVFGCKKNVEQNKVIDGGNIYTSQIVRITVANNLATDVIGILNGEDITMTKISSQEICFAVPFTSSIGETILEIPDLNLKVKYNILKPVLTETAEKTFEPLLLNMDKFKKTISKDTNSLKKSNAIYSIDMLDQELTSATEEEKKLFAEFYFVNKSLIDAIYETDFTQPLSKYDNLSNHSIFKNFAISTGLAVAMSAASYTLLAGGPVGIAVAAAAAAIAIKCWINAYELVGEIYNRGIFSVDFTLDGIRSSLTGGTEVIEYTDEEDKEQWIKELTRTINEQDKSHPIDAVRDFFEKRLSFNHAIKQMNKVIDFCNENISFSNLEKVPLLGENNGEEFNNDINIKTFEKIDISVLDENVMLEKVEFKDNRLVTKVKIQNPDLVSSDYLNTKLKLKYKDELNDQEGTYNIRIFKESQDQETLDLLQRVFGWELTPDNSTTSGNAITYDYDGSILKNETISLIGSPGGIEFTKNMSVYINNYEFYNYGDSSYSVSGKKVTFSIVINNSEGNPKEVYKFSGTRVEGKEEFVGNHIYKTFEYYSDQKDKVYRKEEATATATLVH